MNIKNMILFFCTFLVIWSCKQQDATYKDFVIPGGIIYPGKAIAPRAFAGNNRLMLEWLRGRDPRASYARIFWNNYSDSVTVQMPAVADTIRYTFEDLPEGVYTFFIKTYTPEGDVSIPVEVNGKVLGEVYESSLLTRGLNSSTIDAAGKIQLNWAVADTLAGAVATEVIYQDATGSQRTQRFSAKEELSVITDYAPETVLKYRTVYLPDSLAIDTFYTNYTDINKFYFDKKGWKIIAFSTEHGGAENSVNNFIDGTDATRWHGNANSGNYPHFATIDLAIPKTITSVSVWRTTFDSGGDDRGPNRIQFMVSDDNITWTDLGTFNFNRFINGEQSFPLAQPGTGRYFKFIGLDGPQHYLVLGELGLYVR